MRSSNQPRRADLFDRIERSGESGVTANLSLGIALGFAGTADPAPPNIGCTSITSTGSSSPPTPHRDAGACWTDRVREQQ
jgi:hypothetical protein